MKKLLVTSLVCLFVISSSFGQRKKRGKIAWGPKYDHKGYYSIVGKSGEHIYAYHLGGSFFAKTPNIKVLKFNKAKKIVDEFKIHDIIGDDRKLMDINCTDNSIVVLTFDPKRQIVEKIKIQSKNLKVLEEEVVIEFEEEFEYFALGYSNNYWSTHKRTLSQRSSSDNSKFGLVVSNKKNNRVYVDILILDRHNFYNEINSSKLDLDDKKEKEVLKSIDIREDGSFSALVKHYFTGSEKEKKNNAPNYNFHVYKKSLDSELSSVKVGVGKLYLSGSNIVYDEDDNIYFAALYEVKEGKGAEGTILFKINQQNEIEFERKNKSKGIKDGKERLDKDFVVTSFIRSGDNYLIAYQEKEIVYKRWTNTTSNFTTVDDYVEFKNKNMVVDFFDNDGNHLWSKILYMKKKQRHDNQLIEPQITYDNERIYMFTNSHKKNMEEGRVNFEKQKEKKFPNDDNIITKIIIDKDGSLTFDQLTPPGEIHIGRSCVRVFDGTVYFLSFQERFDNLRLGTMPLAGTTAASPERSNRKKKRKRRKSD